MNWRDDGHGYCLTCGRPLRWHGGTTCYGPYTGDNADPISDEGYAIWKAAYDRRTLVGRQLELEDSA